MSRLTLRLSDELHQQITDRAERERRSVNAELLHLLTAALNAPAEEVDRWARERRS